MTAPPRKPKLLFVVTEDWYFCSHRLPLALAARDAGFDVTLAARIGERAALLQSHGIALAPWKMERGSTGPLAELRALLRLWRIYRAVGPDLVHQVALKPVLYGSLIAKWCRTGAVVNALGGMGSLFAAGGKGTLLQRALLRALRWLLGARRTLLILQNDDDAGLIVGGAGLARERIRIIRGAGVDLDQFRVRPEADAIPLVVLPARMLWDKGVGEFVAAARLLRAQGVVARFALAGGTDECNPSGIARDQLEQWVAEGAVEWLGQRQDMAEVLAMSHLVCLPSYREGLPKALLEAAASGRAIVTTDVPGCRDIVRDGDNGLLVPARDATALAAALGTLLGAPERRRAMGARGRCRAETEFSEAQVVRETLAIYAELLPGALGSTDHTMRRPAA